VPAKRTLDKGERIESLRTASLSYWMARHHASGDWDVSQASMTMLASCKAWPSMVDGRQ
jgi:hypothetical protein